MGTFGQITSTRTPMVINAPTVDSMYGLAIRIRTNAGPILRGCRMSPARKHFSDKDSAREFLKKLSHAGIWAARVAQNSAGTYCVNAYLDGRKQFDRFEFDLWI